MKPNPIIRHLLIALAATAPLTSAATLYWNGADTTANADGGDGTWDTSTANWDNAATAGSATIWSNATPDSAVFGAAAGTVTLGEDISAAGILFGTSGYSVSNGEHILTFSAGSGISLSFGPSYNAADNTFTSASITGALAGSGNLSFSILPFVTRSGTSSPVAGAGTLTLNGATTGGWLGATTVENNFTLALTESNQALLSTSAISLSGGVIRLVNADGTEAALNRIGDSAAITSNGGTIAFNNASGEAVYAEALGSVALTSGQTNFVLGTNQLGDGSQTLTLGGLTRSGATNSSAVTFASAGSLNTTKNMVVVTGATETPAGQILGPWATTGTAANAQNDYAVINGAGQVVPAALTATTDDTTWTDPSLPYELNTGSLVTLAENRTVDALQFFGAASTLTLADKNLETYGLFFSGANAKTVSSAEGALTTPTGGGNLYITTGQAAHTISATVADNDGAVTLIKSGSGTLYLNSTTNSHSGGTIINAGNIQIGPNVTSTFTDAALGAPGVVGETLGAPVVVNGNCSINATFGGAGGNFVTFNRAFAINNNAILRFNIRGNTTITGPVTGTGGIINGNPNAQGNTWSLLSTANTFTGPVFLNLTNNQPNNLVVNSFADGYGRIVMSAGTSTATFRLGTGAIAPLVLNERQFEVTGSSGATGPVQIDNQNTDANNTITVNTDFINTALATSRTLTLTGVNTGNNTFAGQIANGSVAATALTKTGAGSWTLSGDNTHTGLTTVSGGTLTLSGNNSAASGGVTVTASRLNIGNANALGTGSLSIGGTGPSIDNTSGAPLTVATNNPQVWNGDFTFVGTHDLNLGTGAVALGGTRLVTVTANTLMIGGAISGVSPRGIQKLGAGTMVLNGVNTYEGSTNVNGGILTLGVSDCLADISNVIINNGTLNLADGVSDTAGTLNANNAAAKMNIGSGATIAFADSSAVTWAGALDITGDFVSGTSIRFGTSVSGLTGDQLALITVNGSGTFTLDANGFLTTGAAPTGFAAWQAANSTAGGLGDDHDNDGVSNGVEFFLGGAANTTGFTALPGVTNTGGTLSITWTKAADYTGSYGTRFVVQTSDTLEGGSWTNETEGVNVTITGNDVTFTFPSPLGTKKFARLVVTGP